MLLLEKQRHKRRKFLFRINSKALLSVKISFSLQNLGLVTQRIINSSWFIFAGGLLGSIFGLFGSFATILGFCEDWVDKVAKRYENRKMVKKILNDRFSINANFLSNEKVYFKVDSKVVPSTLEDAR